MREELDMACSDRLGQFGMFSNELVVSDALEKDLILSELEQDAILCDEQIPESSSPNRSQCNGSFCIPNESFCIPDGSLQHGSPCNVSRWVFPLMNSLMTTIKSNNIITN